MKLPLAEIGRTAKDLRFKDNAELSLGHGSVKYLLASQGR